MLVAAAVCPHPPLLVPEVAGGAAAELAGLRESCDEAVRRLLGARLDLLTVVGSGPSTCTYQAQAGGSFQPYGVDVRVGYGEHVLPLSLTVGAWLLERLHRSAQRSCPPHVSLQAVDPRSPGHACLALGEELGGAAERVGLLVMGDGSARRDPVSPGYLDHRASGFDRTAADALATGDPRALAALDPDVARELLVAGRSPWQVLAGAAQGGCIRAELLADEAPYGVNYLVASWTRRC